MDRRAIFQHHAGGAAAIQHDFAHRTVGADIDARFRTRLCHRLRDRAHAADGVTPGALDAVHFTEDVVQQHISRTGRVRAGIGARDRVEAEHALQRIGLEPVIQNIARALREEIDQIALPFHAEMAHAVAHRERAEQIA